MSPATTPLTPEGGAFLERWGEEVMPTGMSATLREEPPLTVIDLSGEITTFSEEAILATYAQASEKGAREILLSFTNVCYINSAGIAVIIAMLTEARKRDQRLLVTGLTPHYAKIFTMMGLTQYVPIYDTEAEARQSLSAAHADGEDT